MVYTLHLFVKVKEDARFGFTENLILNLVRERYTHLFTICVTETHRKTDKRYLKINAAYNSLACRI